MSSHPKEKVICTSTWCQGYQTGTRQSQNWTSENKEIVTYEADNRGPEKFPANKDMMRITAILTASALEEESRTKLQISRTLSA